MRPDILAQPFVKNSTEKIAKGFSRDRAVAYAAPVRLKLDQRQKPQIAGPDLLEEPVHLSGMSDILVMDHAEYIAGDSVFLQEPVPAHRLLMGGLLASC